MSTTFNMFDLIFFVGSFVLILVAFFRGFIKELFSLINWVITISLSYLLTPYAAKFVEHYSQNKLIINVASGVMVFITIFIIIFFATRQLANDWKDKMSENADRILGMFYGVFKTLLIFGLFYAITLNFYSSLLGKNSKSSKHEEKTRDSEKDLPQWLQNAQSFPIIKFSGKIIEPIFSGLIDGITDTMLEDVKVNKENLDDKIDTIVDEDEKVKNDEEAVGGKGGALSDKKSGTGYSKKEIEKMNRLIEIVN